MIFEYRILYTKKKMETLLEQCKECGEYYDILEMNTEIENTCAKCLERMNEGETISEQRNNFYN